MAMRTGPKLKGKAVAATQGRTRNNDSEASSHQKLMGKAVAPTQGRTRNHPNVAPVPKAKIGVGVADTYHANSRESVDKKFDRHPHD